MSLKMLVHPWLWSPLLCVLFLGSASYGQEDSEETTSKKEAAAPAKTSNDDYWTNPKNWHASSPTSLLLPSKVVRFRQIMAGGAGEYGWDSDGNKMENGIAANVGASIFVLEYGFSDRLTAQILVPYVYKNELGLDAAQFRTSEPYKKNVATFLDGAANLMMANGVCSATDECMAKIDAGYALPADTGVTLPTGEVATAKAGIPLKQQADSIVINAAKPESGDNGLGDIELGVAYNFVNEGPVLFSAALGLRMPTGTFEDVPAARRTTGSGHSSLGLRSYLDVPLVPGMILSSEHQMEYALGNAKRKKSSILEPTKLNEADPTTAAAIAAGGDGKEEDEYEKEGLRHVGKVRYKYGLGLINKALFQFGLATGLDYDIRPAVKVNGETSSEASSQNWWNFGATYDLLPQGIPLRFVYDFFVPISGKETLVTTTQQQLQVHAFYRF